VRIASGIAGINYAFFCKILQTMCGRAIDASADLPDHRGAMQTFSDALATAAGMLAAGDLRLFAIVLLSLEVSLAATLIAAAVGLPLGAVVALARFPGRSTAIVALNAMMGLPPVVVGLVVYLLLSRAGPLGALGLLFTPGAMVFAQTILIVPILAALARQIVEDAWAEHGEQLRSLDAHLAQSAATLLWDSRYALFTVVFAGFGRASAEVGAVMIVGGNIDGVTRTMTTAIALETSKGDLPLALGLGIVLIATVLAVNAAAGWIRETAARRYG
jgi:tungstate transport system permease protein